MILPTYDCCETETCDSSSVAIPGPPGSNGSNGANGIDGINAFTTTTAQFTMPAEAATVSVAVVSSAAFAISQTVFIGNGSAQGYFLVISKPDATHLNVFNVEQTASQAYAFNSAPGTNFTIGAIVSPAGIQGPSGPNCLSSAGSPEGVVTASPLTFCFDTVNMALYIKLTGVGNTGWQVLLSA